MNSYYRNTNYYLSNSSRYRWLNVPLQVHRSAVLNCQQLFICAVIIVFWGIPLFNLGASAASTRISPDSISHFSFLPISPSYTPSPTVQSNSDFSINLLNTIVKELRSSKDARLRNVVVSPFFLEVSLSLLYNGAEGKTKDQIAAILRQKHETMDQYTVDNMTIYEQFEKLEELKSNYKFTHASHIWVDHKLSLNEGFASLATDKFGTKVSKNNLADPNAATNLDNEFLSETDKKFPKVLKTVPNTSKIVMVLAQYYQGFFKKRFKSMGFTDFFLANGKVKPMEMMYQVGSFEYLEDSYCKAARIPYNKTDIVLEIFVPRTNDGINQIGDYLNAVQLKKWRDAFQPKKGTVVLPVFSISARQNLMGVLSTMGLSSAFSDLNANFKGVVDANSAKIGKMTSGSVIDIDESGTPVTAQQDVEDAKITKLPGAFYIKADHPFFFIIRKTTEDKILFTGLVLSPRESKAKTSSPNTSTED